MSNHTQLACTIYQATFFKTPSPFFDQPFVKKHSQPESGKNSHFFYFISKGNADLVVGGTALRELEVDVAACQTAVDLRVGVEAVVNTTTLLLVKDDLEGLGAVLLGADALADDLDGVGEILEDGVVDSSESSRTGALLLLGVAGAGGSLGAGQDAARSEDQDMAVRELLLELTGETLLDAVEALQGRDGDKDDNSLLAVANLDLVKIPSQHASSRTKPWTASRPVPQKSMILRLAPLRPDDMCKRIKSIISRISTEKVRGREAERPLREQCSFLMWEQDFSKRDTSSEF